jgi:TonB family protein
LEVKFSDLHMKGNPRSAVYPPLARVAEVQGVVVVRITGDARGNVDRSEVLSGPGLLRPAAEALSRGWAFDPVLSDGNPVKFCATVGIPFRLTDVPVREGEPKAPSVILEVERSAIAGSVPVDVGALRAEVAVSLLKVGLNLVESLPEPPDSFRLTVKIETLRTPDDLYLQSVHLRFSRNSDRDLRSNVPGAPARICTASHFLGQRGEAGFQESLARNVERTLQDLTLYPQLPFSTEAPVKTRNPPSAISKAVEFDFSQIKIKRQPPAPPYPPFAKANRVQGKVVLMLTIDPTGRSIHAEALEGPGVLLLTALRYALDWEFEPARLNGIPQWARFKLTMPFRLL